MPLNTDDVLLTVRYKADGQLAMDKNGNGRIDNITELYGDDVINSSDSNSGLLRICNNNLIEGKMYV